MHDSKKEISYNIHIWQGFKMVNGLWVCIASIRRSLKTTSREKLPYKLVDYYFLTNLFLQNLQLSKFENMLFSIILTQKNIFQKDLQNIFFQNCKEIAKSNLFNYHPTDRFQKFKIPPTAHKIYLDFLFSNCTHQKGAVSLRAASLSYRSTLRRTAPIDEVYWQLWYPT